MTTHPTVDKDVPVKHDDATVDSFDDSVSETAQKQHWSSKKIFAFAAVAVLGVAGIAGAVVAAKSFGCGNHDQNEPQDPPLSPRMVSLMEESNLPANTAEGHSVSISRNGLVMASAVKETSSTINVSVYEQHEATEEWLPRSIIVVDDDSASEQGVAMSMSPEGGSIAVGTANQVCVYGWDGSYYVPRGECLISQDQDKHFAKFVEIAKNTMAVCDAQTCTIYDYHGEWKPKPNEDLPYLDINDGPLVAVSLSDDASVLLMATKTAAVVCSWGSDSGGKWTSIAGVKRPDNGELKTATMSADGLFVALGQILQGEPQVYVMEKMDRNWVQRGDVVPSTPRQEDRMLRSPTTNKDENEISLALNKDGSKVAVAVTGPSQYQTENFGIRVFEFEGSNWTETSSAIDQDCFFDLDLDDEGDVLAVGRSDKILVYSVE